MELKLQNFVSCYENTDLFKEVDSRDSQDNSSGMFVVTYRAPGRMVRHFYWTENSLIHRVDGPAVICAFNVEWWFMGKRVTGIYSIDDYNTWLRKELGEV